MKILVTGGLGFIGSNFCRHLITHYPNYHITNVDKIGKGANLDNLKDMEKENRYKFIKGNICDPHIAEKCVKRADVIINIAAETHVDRSITNPLQFFENNIMGTFTLLEAIRKYKDNVRFTQVSTDEVYGEIAQGTLTEMNSLNPSNPYSASKAAADMFVIAYWKTYNLHTNITRCTNNFGPYQLPEKLIPKIIIRALKDQPLPIYGSGKNIRDWLYVQDHCEALIDVVRNGKPGKIYNISAGNELPNIKIVKKILNLLNKPESLITFVEDRPGHDYRYSLNSTKIRSELSWKPKFPFEEALKSTVNWYVENRWWWRPLATAENLQATPWKPRDKP